MSQPSPGPAAGVTVWEPNGLGIAPKPALDPFGVWRRRRQKNLVPGRQWFSPLAYYLGPFDEVSGLEGSASLFQKTSINKKPPQVYLTATEAGLGIVPTANSTMKKARGSAETLWVPYSNIERVELRPASKARMPMMLPKTAYRLGQVIVTTRDHREATLSGTTVADLAQFLASLGAATKS